LDSLEAGIARRLKIDNINESFAIIVETAGNARL
jgi:hypothetical protein